MEWRQIPGWPNYEVSNEGQVRRTIRIRVAPKHSLLKMFLRVGYPTVSLCYGGGSQRAKKYMVHELVLLAFVGPRPAPDYVVAHYDGNKENNRIENLRWATRAENEEDKKRHGTTPRLNWELVRKIRTVWADLSSSQIGRMLNTDQSYICKVKRGDYWRE